MDLSKKLDIKCNGEQWKYLGRGSYNVAYLSPDKKSVLKIPIEPSDKSENPFRAVRLWNQINPDLTTKAKVVFFKRRKRVGWICPFVAGEQASDAQISEKVIDI